MPKNNTRKRDKKPRRGRRIASALLNAGLILLLVVLTLALGGALARIFGIWGGDEADHQAAQAAQQLQDIATASAVQQGTPAPNTPAGPPKRMGPVEVSTTEVDLGQVPISRWVTPSFKVRNVGQAPLVLMFDNVETLEGC
ncbi:MAG: hypothetical protein HYY01_03080 [Chloroflexi bacterium]|nr:hypothetical protein [Chloroflexota bacterium]